MLDSLVRVSRRVLKLPKAKASPTGVHGRDGSRPHKRSLSEDTVANSLDGSGGVEARVPRHPPVFTASTCDGPDANLNVRGPAPLRYRRAGRPGDGGPNGNGPKAPLGLHPDPEACTQRVATSY